MAVNSTNQQYQNAKDRWRLVRDCVEGQESVKRGGYLPVLADDDKVRQERYTERALFLNVTGRTLSSLVGAAFRKEAQVIVPPSMSWVLANADNNCNSVNQLAKSIVHNVTAIGRHGLLVDYPDVDGTPTAEDIARLGLRPVISSYTAESIINWRKDNNGQLVLVVLHETNADSADEFDLVATDQYRVLRLTDGVYTQQLYDAYSKPISGVITPRKADGTAWNFIPFIIAGSVNNDPDVDPVVLYDLAAVNIAHYRNSADYEEGVFLHGQPMLHIDAGNMSADDWQRINPSGVTVGARRGIVTTGGGNASLIQADANRAAFEAMAHKEAQMVKIGARIIESGASNETAFGVRVRSAAESSVLESVVSNVQDALEKCLIWAAYFVGADASQISVEINNDFFDIPPDPQVIAQLMGLESVGTISKEVTLNYLRKTNIVPSTMTDEEIANAIENRGP